MMILVGKIAERLCGYIDRPTNIWRYLIGVRQYLRYRGKDKEISAAIVIGTSYKQRNAISAPVCTRRPAAEVNILASVAIGHGFLILMKQIRQ
jgi:hypothetical protein